MKSGTLWKLLAVVMALALCLGLLAADALAAAISLHDGSDPGCIHANYQTTYKKGTTPGSHIRRTDCPQCGGWAEEEEGCIDTDQNGWCDNCKENIPGALGDLSSATVKLSTSFSDKNGNPLEYVKSAGITVEPPVSVWMGQNYLYPDDDYTVTYSNSNQLGTATVTVTATSTGRVTGSTEATYTLKTLTGDLSDSSNTVDLYDENWAQLTEFKWSGSQIKPNVMVELDGNVTLPGGYTVSYGENKNPGEGTVTVKGTGEEEFGVRITGEKTVKFTIVKDPQSCDHVGTERKYTNLGNGMHDVICGKCNTSLGQEAHAYTNKGAQTLQNDPVTHLAVLGKADMCVCGAKTNFKPEYSNLGISPIPDQTFTGNPVEPEIDLKGDEKTEQGETVTVSVPKSEFTVSYENNIGPGTAKVIAEIGTEKVSKEFKIVCDHPEAMRKYQNLGNGMHDVICGKCNTSLGQEAHAYTNKGAQTLQNDPVTHLAVLGKADMCVCGAKTNFKPEYSNLGISPIPDQLYTGEPIEPEIELKADEKTEDGKTITTSVPKEEYTVSYENNVDIGTGLVIAEIGGETVKKEFQITNCVHPNAKLTSISEKQHQMYCPDCKHYLGEPESHDIQTTETNEGHYHVITDTCSKCDYHDRREICRHDGEVTYVNDASTDKYMKGTHHIECNICHENISGPLPHQIVEGKAFYRNELEYGRYETCSQCDYSAWVTLPRPKELKDAKIADIPDQKYDGKPVTPEENVTLYGWKLIKGQDYTVEYENNDKPGTGVIIIKPLEGVSIGEKRKEFKIKDASPEPTTAPTEQVVVVETPGPTAEPTPVVVTPNPTPYNATCAEVGHNWGQWNKLDEEHCIRVCVRCGAEETPNHEFGDWIYAGAKHSKICHHCVYVVELDHDWENITITRENTCNQPASVEAYCPTCKYTSYDMPMSELQKLVEAGKAEADKVLPLGHDFENGKWWNCGPTLVTDPGQGTHCKLCARCGVPDSANKTGHHFGTIPVVQAGECENPSQPRIEEAYCVDCGAHLRRVTELHHNQVRYPEGDIEPTCTEFGKEAYQCTICKQVFGDAIQPLGHDIEIVEKVDATCETEGFIHRKCTRCDLDETEILKTLSPDGKHHFEPVASQEPTCTKDGQYNGEKCIYCPATQDGKTGYDTIPALGHKVVSSTASHGRTRTAVGKDGRPIEMQVYVTTFSCKRCGASLGGEIFTVATSVGKMGGQYLIESGNVTITDMENGIHVNGNMQRDGGVRFRDEVQKGFDEVIKNAGTKYTYKKTETKSFVIEFTDEFLAEIEDGEYELVVINGSEYWPMMVTVQDHKFKALRDVDVPDMPELTEEEFNALLSELSADGTEITSRFMLVQPCIEAGAPNENGDIAVIKKDGDYDFASIVNGEYTLAPDQDYTLEGDTITLKADYLNGLTGETEIVFQYAPFDMDGAPAPHNPILTVSK